MAAHPAVPAVRALVVAVLAAAGAAAGSDCISGGDAARARAAAALAAFVRGR